jgi:Macroglobulin domain MG3
LLVLLKVVTQNFKHFTRNLFYFPFSFKAKYKYFGVSNDPLLISPSQSLKLDLPKRVFESDGTFQVKVTPTYNFGKIVDGIAEITFWRYETVLTTSPPLRTISQKTVYTKTIEISGIPGTIDVYVTSLNTNDDGEINVFVKFTDSSTGKKMDSSAVFIIEKNTYEIISIGTDNFVPNELYNLKVFLRKIGEGRPVSISLSFDLKSNSIVLGTCWH